MTIRKKVVEIARAEIGPGQVDAYWADVLGPNARPPYPRHWCGAFALWCLHQAGLALDVRWVIGRGFLELQRLPKVKVPQPGDVAYFHEPFQHHALVADVVDGTMLVTIDGNQGQPQPVRQRMRSMPGGAVFYSIQPFILAGASREPDTEPAPPPVELEPEGASIAPDLPTLRQGASGVAVSEIQRVLGCGVDGHFGPRTRAAVITFQRAHRLVADGVVGPKTWAALLQERGR